MKISNDIRWHGFLKSQDIPLRELNRNWAQIFTKLHLMERVSDTMCQCYKAMTPRSLHLQIILCNRLEKGPPICFKNKIKHKRPNLSLSKEISTFTWFVGFSFQVLNLHKPTYIIEPNILKMGRHWSQGIIDAHRQNHPWTWRFLDLNVFRGG